LDGSGKSLLLQVVAGLVTPDMGDVKINKKSLLRNYRKVYINSTAISLV
jgi:ABC-type sulfate/molybdate transport systems ATPase subunit